MKKTYVAARITLHGDIRELTRGGAKGSMLDADFKAGTPFGSLTFSP